MAKPAPSAGGGWGVLPGPLGYCQGPFIVTAIDGVDITLADNFVGLDTVAVALSE